MPPIQLLLIQANPLGGQPLNLSIEQRNLQEALNSARLKINLKVLPAGRIADIPNYLRGINPQIVHFSCHGDGEGGLHLNAPDDHGGEVIKAYDLADIFRTHQAEVRHRVRFVVLAGCWTNKTAELLAEHVDCVVGFAGDVPDDDFIDVFTPQLYAALGDDRSPNNAVDSACTILRSRGMDRTADLVSLHVRPGVDRSRTWPTAWMSTLLPPELQHQLLYQSAVAALYLGRLCDTRYRSLDQTITGIQIGQDEQSSEVLVFYGDGHKSIVRAVSDVTSQDEVWAKLWRRFTEQFRSSDFSLERDHLLLWIGSSGEDQLSLTELCNNARASSSFIEWHQKMSQVQTRLAENIRTYLPIEIADSESLYRFLAALHVETSPLTQIERELAPQWMPEISDKYVPIFDLLRSCVDRIENIPGSFRAHNLRSSLEQEHPGLHFVTPIDIEAVRRATKNAGSLLRQHRHTIGSARIHIPRPVVDDIVLWAQREVESSKNVALLVDQAGMGKTVVLHDVMCVLQSHDLDVLAIKADQQLSNVTSLSDIQASLGLGQSAIEVVERLAKLNRVVVIIDQVDALSLSLARDQRTLDVVIDLVARLRQIANVFIIMSCRIFDLNSDPRLKRMEFSRRFQLERLTEQEIGSVLGSVGVDFQGLTKATQELLRTPLHLDLYMQAIENGSSHNTQREINSLQELYNNIWEQVICRLEPNSPSAADRKEVLYRLTSHMHNHREIAAPYSLLESDETQYLLPAARWLESTGILFRGGMGASWSFLHQTFFDYCYARHFVESGKDLEVEILSSDQGLFVRPQLLQVISFLRGADQSRYLRTVHQLLAERRIRYHLRDLLLRWFGALSDPSEYEWLIACRILADPTKQLPLLRYMCGNIGWFDRVSTTFLPSWLADEQMMDNQVMSYLISFVDTRQADIIRFVTPLLMRSELWTERIRTILFSIRDWCTANAIGLFEQYAIRRPMLDQGDFHHLVAVARANPATGCRLVHHVLQYQLDRYLERRIREQEQWGDGYALRFDKTVLYSQLRLLDDTQLDVVIAGASSSEPRQFLSLMVPWLASALTSYRPPTDATPEHYIYDELSHGWFEERLYIVRDALVEGLITAMRIVSDSDPEFFAMQALDMASMPYRTPQMILMCVYASLPQTHALAACEFLLADQRRLGLVDNGNCNCRQVIGAIFPYLEYTNQLQLEEYILSYVPVYKSQGVEGLRWSGIEQLALLQAIPVSYLSLRSSRRLRELERKFPDSRVADVPRQAEFGKVGSPIAIERARLMSDEDWLRAMRKHQGRLHHRELFRGGGEELAAVLSELVKENPDRFYQLLAQAPDEIDDPYVIGFINAFAESALPAECLYAVVRRFAYAPDRDLKQSIARAVKRRAEEGVPDDIVAILFSYLDGPPGDEEWWWAKGDNHGDAYLSFLNSDRGSAYGALMRVFDLQNTSESVERKWSLIGAACADESVALRSGALYELMFMLKHDQKRSLSCYSRLIKGYETLLSLEHNQMFLYRALWRNFLALQPHIEAMMEYPDEVTQQRGAELACIAAISPAVSESEEAGRAAEALAEKALLGISPWRRGAARIYASNITRDAMNECLPRVLHLLADSDQQVRQIIGGIFFSLGAAQFYALRPFIESYIHQVVPPEHQCLNYLWEHGLLDPAWTLVIVREVAARISTQEQGGFFSGINEMIRLVVRIYNNPTTETQLRSEAMDVFDVFMERFSLQAQAVLSEWDSR